MGSKIVVTRVSPPRIIRYRTQPDSIDWCFCSMCVCLTIVILCLVIPIIVLQGRFCNKNVKTLCLSPNKLRDSNISSYHDAYEAGTKTSNVEGWFARKFGFQRHGLKWNYGRSKRSTTTTQEVPDDTITESQENDTSSSDEMNNKTTNATEENTSMGVTNVSKKKKKKKSTRLMRKRVLPMLDWRDYTTSKEPQLEDKRTGGVIVRDAEINVDDGSIEMKKFPVIADDHRAYVAVMDIANVVTADECVAVTTYCQQSTETSTVVCKKTTKAHFTTTKKIVCVKPLCICTEKPICRCSEKPICRCSEKPICRCSEKPTWCKCYTPDQCMSTTRRCKVKLCTVYIQCPKTKRTTVYDCDEEEPWSFAVARVKVTPNFLCEKDQGCPRVTTKRRYMEKFPAWWSCKIKCTKTTLCEEYEAPKCDCVDSAPSCASTHGCKRMKVQLPCATVHRVRKGHRARKRRLRKRLTTPTTPGLMTLNNRSQSYENSNCTVLGGCTTQIL